MRSYFGENLQKFGKNFIEIINYVARTKEILETQQYAIIVSKYRRYYRVVGIEKC